MICRECVHAIIGKTQGDRDMSRLGYRICELAKTPVERATYHSGGQKCRYQDRVKNK